MTADMVTFAVMGAGFCHAASSLMLHRVFSASIVMTQKWAEALTDRQRGISAR
jgi:hypothetical protein